MHELISYSETMISMWGKVLVKLCWLVAVDDGDGTWMRCLGVGWKFRKSHSFCQNLRVPCVGYSLSSPRPLSERNIEFTETS